MLLILKAATDRRCKILRYRALSSISSSSIDFPLYRHMLCTYYMVWPLLYSIAPTIWRYFTSPVCSGLNLRFSTIVEFETKQHVFADLTQKRDTIANEWIGFICNILNACHREDWALRTQLQASTMLINFLLTILMKKFQKIWDFGSRTFLALVCNDHVWIQSSNLIQEV